MRRLLTKYWGFFLVLALSFWAIKPFFVPGFFPMHDDTQVVRVFEMGQALRDGHFPVRWVKDLGYGYGYPLFNFYAPLPYYVGGFITVVGFDPLASTKATMVLGILLSGIFMYLLAREFWGEMGGVVSGLFYMYAPYHAVDIYVRGAVGEYWAVSFIPLTFYGLWKGYQEKKWMWVVVGSLGFAGIVTSHNLTALIVTPFIIITTLLHGYIAYKNKRPFFVHSSWFIVLLGLGLASFYWIPALAEIGYTNIASQVGGGADFRDHFVCVSQLWESQWGFGGSTPGCIDGMSFKIGKLHILVSLMAFVMSLYFFKKDKVRSTIILFTIFYLLFSIYMMLEISKPFWEALPSLVFVQYSWRFLVIATFTTSFLAGVAPWALRHFNTVLYLSSAGLIVLLLSTNLKLFQSQTILLRTSSDYTSEENIKWTTSKISDEYMPKGFAKPTNSMDIVRVRSDDMGEVATDKTQEFTLKVNASQETAVLIHIAPFPAWQVYVDDNPIQYISKSNGIEVEVPKGEHDVRISFTSTPIERIANVISIISGLVLIGGILLRKAR